MKQLNWPDVLANQTREIVELLNNENLKSYAENIYNGLLGGATGSEIWGAVRLHLTQVPSRLAMPSTMDKILKLIKEIENIYPGYFT